MILVTILKSDNDIVGYEISGHAQYGDYGEDIICSAVSVLSQNTLLSILNLTEGDVDYEIKEGYLRFIFNNKISEKDKLLIDSLKLGIENLIESYPKHIKIKIQEV